MANTETLEAKLEDVLRHVANSWGLQLWPLTLYPDDLILLYLLLSRSYLVHVHLSLASQGSQPAHGMSLINAIRSAIEEFEPRLKVYYPESLPSPSRSWATSLVKSIQRDGKREQHPKHLEPSDYRWMEDRWKGPRTPPFVRWLTKDELARIRQLFGDARWVCLECEKMARQQEGAKRSDGNLHTPDLKTQLPKIEKCVQKMKDAKGRPLLRTGDSTLGQAASAVVAEIEQIKDR